MAAPAYTTIRLDDARSAVVRAALEAGDCPRVIVDMEVIALSSHGVALLWASDATGRRGPRLTTARMSPSRQAEVMLALAEGLQPHLRVSFSVLSEHPRTGRFGVACMDPDGELTLREPVHMH